MVLSFPNGVAVKLERAYDLAKKYGWPHFFVPLFALVLIDYIHVLLHFISIGLLAYVTFQSVGFVFGTMIGLMIKLRGIKVSASDEAGEGMWGEFLKYRLAKVIPTVTWGRKFCDWLLTEEPKPEEPAVEPTAE